MFLFLTNDKSLISRSLLTKSYLKSRFPCIKILPSPPVVCVCDSNIVPGIYVADYILRI